MPPTAPKEIDAVDWAEEDGEDQGNTFIDSEKNICSKSEER
jgi:hypothetical protein